MRTIAVIDIGSNTVLYLLASDENGLTILDEGIAQTRLGKGSGKRSDPDESILLDTLKAVETFTVEARYNNAEEIIIVATEAMRRAPWGKTFATRLEKAAGIPISILSSQEEGELSLLAARYSLSLGDGTATVLDVGGGSVQIVTERVEGSPRVRSYPLGCVVLTERFSSGGELDRDSLSEYVNIELAEIGRLRGPFVVTGGTATTAAAIIEGIDEYSPDELHGQRYIVTRFRGLANKIARLSQEKRRYLRGMPPARVDIFEAGLLVIIAIMDKTENAETVVSCRGVRFGAAYRYFDMPPK